MTDTLRYTLGNVYHMFLSTFFEITENTHIHKYSSKLEWKKTNYDRVL